MPFPVDVTFVNQTERKLGVKFPPAYVNAIVKSNGGEIETEVDFWHLFPIFDTSDIRRLKRTCNDVVRETRSAQDRPGFPPEAVAIGSIGGRDLLILIRRSDNHELLDHAVNWWDHETDEVEKVANGFSDL